MEAQFLNNSEDIKLDPETKEKIKAAMEQKDSDFIKSLIAHNYCCSSDTYKLRRALGRAPKEVIDVYMAFMNASGGLKNISKKYEDVYFLISCMFYLYENSDSYDSSRKKISFGRLLSRLAKESKSTNKNIAFMVNSDYTSNGMFLSQFVRFAKRCKSLLRSDERLDFYRLLQDLKFWNNPDHKVRLRWVTEIYGY